MLYFIPENTCTNCIYLKGVPGHEGLFRCMAGGQKKKGKRSMKLEWKLTQRQ